MCWSAAASLNTFLFSLFGFAVGVANRAFRLPTLVFMLLFSTVQLAEYFIWTHLDDPRRNALASQFLFLVLLAEPYATAWTIPDPRARRAVWAAYTAFLAAALLAFARAPIQWRSSPGANGHLQWHAMDGFRVAFWIWALFLVGPLLVAKNYVGFAFGAATFAVSAYFYWKYGTAGTMWCWIATAAWLAVIWTAVRSTTCGLTKK